MSRLLALALLPLLVVSGCANQGPVQDTTKSDTVTLYLTQDTAEGNAVHTGSENCLALTPPDGETLEEVSAVIDWNPGEDAPDQLRLGIFEVSGGQTLADTTGGPGLEASASGSDTKVNIVVTLPEGSQATVEKLPVELAYELSPADTTIATASCQP